MVNHHQALDATFAALADPTRRGILARLARGDLTIKEIASRCDMSLPAVSKHVYVLEGAGLARVTREGRSRRTALVAAPMRAAAEWMETYRKFWEHQLGLLAAYVEGVTAQEKAAWPEQQPPQPRRSKSAARSRHHASASSRPSRARRSSSAGRRRRR